MDCEFIIAYPTPAIERFWPFSSMKSQIFESAVGKDRLTVARLMNEEDAMELVGYDVHSRIDVYGLAAYHRIYKPTCNGVIDYIAKCDNEDEKRLMVSYAFHYNLIDSVCIADRWMELYCKCLPRHCDVAIARDVLRRDPDLWKHLTHLSPQVLCKLDRVEFNPYIQIQGFKEGAMQTIYTDVDGKRYAIDSNTTCRNPLTRRSIKISGPTFRSLLVTHRYIVGENRLEEWKKIESPITGDWVGVDSAIANHIETLGYYRSINHYRLSEYRRSYLE